MVTISRQRPSIPSGLGLRISDIGWYLDSAWFVLGLYLVRIWVVLVLCWDCTWIVYGLYMDSAQIVHSGLRNLDTPRGAMVRAALGTSQKFLRNKPVDNKTSIHHVIRQPS